MAEVPSKNALLRSLPSVEALLQDPSLAQLFQGQPRARVVSALRAAVELARGRLLSSGGPGFRTSDVEQALAQLRRPNLRPVHNATGVVLHTNLGRAPLAEEAIERMAQVARGYSNLELDLDEGERGSRYAPVVELLCALTGAEDALVVNNCAGAVLLAMAALGQGREGIVSRGELVEIGGGFRIPDVMRQSGVTLVEVGTTNRTRLEDYRSALSPQTGLMVKVHRSNFALVGFTEEAPIEALARLAKERDVPLFVDAGSGLLEDMVGAGLTPEPTMRAAIQAGADVVSFSGDKLLGGPQAGVLVGRREWVAKLRSHPLNRALRVDKLVVSALEATLELYRDGRSDELPARRMLQEKTEALKARAERLQRELARVGVVSEVVATTGAVGGGTMPRAELPSYACALAGACEPLLTSLREGDRPVIGRVHQERVLLDVRCLEEIEVPSVVEAVKEACSPKPC